jgi:hypothetical protein
MAQAVRCRNRDRGLTRKEGRQAPGRLSPGRGTIWRAALRLSAPASNVPSGPSTAAATEGTAEEASVAGAGALEVLGFAAEIAGPILMMAQFAGTYGEATAAKKAESYRDGFAQGMAAALLGEPTDVVRGLGLPADGSTAEQSDRLLGAEGIPESYHNKGVRRWLQVLQKFAARCTGEMARVTRVERLRLEK